MSNITPVPFPAARGGVAYLRPDVVQVRDFMVNAYLLGAPGQDWVLVDAGLPGTARLLHAAAAQVHGKRAPSAIILTHGHTDHVGALRDLLREWNVPVYAHPLELPYLTGQMAYTGPNPKIKLLLPASDFRPYIKPLPADGAVPFAPAWRWLHTPGHAVGHVSLWCSADRSLIAGDALGTVEVKPGPGLLTGKPAQVAHAMLYTSRSDGKASVGKLAALLPTLVAAGHGMALQGKGLGAALQEHYTHFDDGFDIQRHKPKKAKGLPRPIKALTALLGLGALLGYAVVQARE